MGNEKPYDSKGVASFSYVKKDTCFSVVQIVIL